MAVKTNYIKNGINYYRITRTIGKKNNGDPIKKEFLGKNKSQAEEKALEYMNKLKLGYCVGFDKATINDLFYIWVFDVVQVSKNKKHSTFERYEGIYRNYIKNSDISGLSVFSIKPLQLQNFYNKLYKNNKTFASIRELNKILKAFFNWCISQDYLIKNPCNRLEIPGNADTNTDYEDEYIDFFSYEEIETIQNNITDDNMKHIFMLALGMGIREGEALGIQLKKIDFEKNTITISNTLSRVKIFKDNICVGSKLELTLPKSKDSIRTLTIPQNIVGLLKEYIHKQYEKWEILGSKFNEESLIFTTNSCNPIDSSDFRKAWAKLLLKSNVRYRKFHCIRHTFASILFHLGVPIKTVQKLLGHSNLKTTEKIYVHVMPAEKEEAIQKINVVFKT